MTHIARLLALLALTRNVLWGQDVGVLAPSLEARSGGVASPAE